MNIQSLNLNLRLNVIFAANSPLLLLKKKKKKKERKKEKCTNRNFASANTPDNGRGRNIPAASFENFIPREERFFKVSALCYRYAPLGNISE